jgi:hypothetical protein
MIHFFVEEGKVNLAFKNKITFKFNFLGKVWSDDFLGFKHWLHWGRRFTV